MSFFLILFLLAAVAAGEALGEICPPPKTPTKLIARRTWRSQTATTTTSQCSSPFATTTTTPLPILFRCSVHNPDCGTMCTNLTSGGGVVQSPNFPGDYGNTKRYCYVYITAPAGWMIQLNFTTFNVQVGKAYVTVGSNYVHGAAGWQTLLPETSGKEIPEVVSATGNMFIGFSSFDSDKPSSAVYNWQATFSVTVPTVPTTAPTSTTMATTTPSPVLFNCSSFRIDGWINNGCENMCGDVTSPTTGVVQSPNYPGDYGNEYRKCQVTITAPKGWMIQLTFTTFNLEYPAYVLVDDGTAFEPAATGNTIPAVVPTNVNKMDIYFKNAGSTKPNTAIYNWQATISVTSDRSSCFVSNSDNRSCGIVCTNVTSAGTGVVQSPNFPGDYGNDYKNCIVSVIVPVGKRIQLTFTTFNLETDHGFIFTSQVNYEDTYHMNGTTGSAIPGVITTDANALFIRFYSDGSTGHFNTDIYNWRATYTAI